MSIFIYLKAKSFNLLRILMINVRNINKCSRHVAMDGMNFNLLYFCLNCNNFASITTQTATLVQYQDLYGFETYSYRLDIHFEYLVITLRPCSLVLGLYIEGCANMEDNNASENKRVAQRVDPCQESRYKIVFCMRVCKCIYHSVSLTLVRLRISCRNSQDYSK
jgi:hypothetical protein